jgi:hypothetical protein
MLFIYKIYRFRCDGQPLTIHSLTHRHCVAPTARYTPISSSQIRKDIAIQLCKIILRCHIGNDAVTR